MINIIKFIDNHLRFIVLAGTAIYITEVIVGGRDSYHSHAIFLWSERIIALIFTVEYFVRWYHNKTDGEVWAYYPTSPLGLIDLISILPFWIGFCVPVEYLRIVRTFRIFRLLKFFRYSRSLQLVALGFYRASFHLRSLGFSMLVVSTFCAVSIYEIEQDAQPDKFRNLFDAIYFTTVTVATVGYGDMSPVTVTGRIIAIGTFCFALSIFAGMLGVLGNSFVKVLEEELDPTIDPIIEFKKERALRTKIRNLENNYHSH